MTAQPERMRDSDGVEPGTQYLVAFTRDWEAAHTFPGEVPTYIGTRDAGEWLVVSEDRSFFEPGFRDDEIVVVDHYPPL